MKNQHKQFQDNTNMGVHVPAHVIDEWLPVLGAGPIVIYILLRRVGQLDPDDVRMDFKDFAEHVDMTEPMFIRHCETLHQHGFIDLHLPTKRWRAKGLKPSIMILDAPDYVSPALPSSEDTE